MFAVLFDLEGTLVSSPVDDINEIDGFKFELQQKMLSLGIPPNLLNQWSESTVTMRDNGFEYAKKCLSARQRFFFTQEIDQLVSKYELGWAEKSQNFPDTITALRKISDFTDRMGIVTNTSRVACCRILNGNNISDFFKVIIAREDVVRMKPDPSGIVMALNQLKVKSFFFIGDSNTDCIAAKKAGGTSVVVKRKNSSKKKDADYVAESLIDACNYIKSRQKL
jgi:HAD superfamily hydrolase (TIGR01549 family)